MPSQKKNIPIKAVLRDYFSNERITIGKLGKLTPKQAEQIQKILTRPAFVHKGSCIQTMTLNRYINAEIGQKPFFLYYCDDHGDFECSFYFGDTQKCVVHTNRKMTEEQQCKICRRNLRDGKCLDETMRKTLGKVLYPHHYLKNKQK